jgi:hypothetical protein
MKLTLKFLYSIHLNSSLFLNVTHCRLDVSELHIGPILKGRAWINNDKSMVPDIPEEQTSFLHHGRSLKSHTDSSDSGQRPVAGPVNAVTDFVCP